MNNVRLKYFDTYTRTWCYTGVMPMENAEVLAASTVHGLAIIVQDKPGFPLVNNHCLHPNCDCEDYCKAEDPHSVPTPISEEKYQ